MQNNEIKNPFTKTPTQGPSKDNHSKQDKVIIRKRSPPKNSNDPRQSSPPSYQVGSKGYISQSEAHIDLLYCKKQVTPHPHKPKRNEQAIQNNNEVIPLKKQATEENTTSNKKQLNNDNVNNEQLSKKIQFKKPNNNNNANNPLSTKSRSPIKITINLMDNNNNNNTTNNNNTIIKPQCSPQLTKKQTLIHYKLDNKDKQLQLINPQQGRRSPIIKSSNTLYTKLTGINNNHNTNNNNSNTLPPFKDFSHSCEQNSIHRKTMEDSYTAITKLGNDINKSFFAIYDGHGGSKASTYCKDNLHSFFLKQLESSSSSSNIEKCIKTTFEQIDKEFLNKNKNCNQMGTTATVVYLYNETNNKRVIYCANVGDSKCFLFKLNGNVLQLTKDHVCSDKMEVERVKKSGGMVFKNRVFGALMVTRSIGDKDMKEVGVIATPFVKKVEINNQEDKYIIIGSDGLWDTINEERMKMIGSEDVTAEVLSKKLVSEAIEGGSMDNVSCIVIKL